ncbi:MAG: alpha,alpha-trehalase, partial [Thermoleophilaceae bacterium]|nr:alpha,alpha-trehalase [Thermoleophilaceae bacterium]
MLQTYPERGAFPAIADYAFIADCEVAALVAPSGNVEWLCLPQFDSPSVFAPMLDRDAGRFRIGPADALVPAARRYLPGSMVLETTWKTRTGWLVVRDALTVGTWHHVDERAHRQRRAPSDWEAEHVLVRTARCAQGIVELSVECEPWFEYGELPADWDYTGETYHEAKASAKGASVDLTL